MGIAFVCFMGIATVFVGLIFIIVISTVMSAVCKRISDKEEKTITQDIAPSQKATDAGIENKQEIVAGVCAVIAEELGTDAKNIRVTSFKKL